MNRFLRSRASGTNRKTMELYHYALDWFIGYPLTPEGIKNYLDSLTCSNAGYITYTPHNYPKLLQKHQDSYGGN